MYNQTIVSDSVPVTYDDQELLNLIEKKLSTRNEEFSFQQLCHYVVNEAKRNGRVEGAPTIRYSSSDISISDGIRISKILWEKIWNKEIFIAFGENPYRAHYNGDIRFIKFSKV